MNEENRLNALKATKLLDTSAEERFDRIVRLATTALGADMALISFLDENRQWFKARVNIDAPETPREQAFCDHAIREPDEVMVVLDPSDDDRFADNPLVTGAPNIRFYAGAPLITKDGHALGTLCVLDKGPRNEFSDAQRQVLKDLAATVMTEIELQNQAQINADLSLINEELQHRMGNMYAHISALVSMLARTDIDKEQLVRRIRQKITSLSHTQALLATRNYRSIPLTELIASALGQFNAGSNSIRVNIQDTDDFDVSARGAFILTLMLNELGTNAIKHGALGRDGGKIDVSWTNGDEIKFKWREFGYAVTDGAASREGFGTQILRKIVPMDLQGVADYNLAADGLLYSVTARPERVRLN